MKKLAITIAIVLGLGLTSVAGPKEGGLFKRGVSDEEYYGMGAFNNGSLFLNRSDTPMLPNHENPFNNDADAPLGTGIALLLGLGGAYLVAKKRREE
ncbi:MAG: hypothetical protein J6P83_05505 [Bacteroidales bacterium]|nr:hypothetical protein [Bacteroidales bacterium]